MLDTKDDVLTTFEADHGKNTFVALDFSGHSLYDYVTGTRWWLFGHYKGCFQKHFRPDGSQRSIRGDKTFGQRL